VTLARIARGLALSVLLVASACTRTTSQHAILMLEDFQVEKGCHAEVSIDNGRGELCRFSREQADLLGSGTAPPACQRSPSLADTEDRATTSR
jgi:hypothetical protein